MSGGVCKSFRSTNDRLRVASDSASNLQSLVNIPIARSYSFYITPCENPVISLSILTVSALCHRTHAQRRLARTVVQSSALSLSSLSDSTNTPCFLTKVFKLVARAHRPEAMAPDGPKFPQIP